MAGLKDMLRDPCDGCLSTSIGFIVRIKCYDLHIDVSF